jgi:hypothetical protein
MDSTRREGVASRGMVSSKHRSTQGIAERITEQFRRLGKQAMAQPMDAVEDPGSYEAFSTEQRRKNKRMRQEYQNHIFRLHDGRSLGYAEYGSQQGYPVLHFHGAGSSRLEYPGGDDDSPTTAVRLLVVDRPGHGLSSFQRQRRVLDWALDVNQLADHLGLDQFAVTGWSAGGPYALACAYALPERVKVGALLSGSAPKDYPGAFQGLPLLNRLLAWSARYVPWLVYPTGCATSFI